MIIKLEQQQKQQQSNVKMSNYSWQTVLHMTKVFVEIDNNSYSRAQFCKCTQTSRSYFVVLVYVFLSDENACWLVSGTFFGIHHKVLFWHLDVHKQHVLNA